MNVSKSYNKIFIAFVCLIVLFFNSILVFAADTNNSHIDAVLVIDTSNSMNGSDPRKIAVDGVKLFVDMMESSGSRVGVIGFNDSITFKTDLTEINSFEDKQNFIDSMGKIRYIGYTDIGMALKEAESMLFSKVDKGNKPMIILFTDGYIETRGVSRTDEKSRNEVYEVLLGAKNHYPIYTIGLNSSGRVDQELIEKIANDTNALSYMTNKSEDLPEIFNKIFADYIKSNIINVGTLTTDGLNYNTININIPNNSVSEANIVMLSNTANAVLDAKLTDPDGNVQAINNNNSVYFSSQGSYSVLKIIQPKKGDWTLSVKGIKGNQVKINLLYNYDISLKAELDSSSVIKKGQDITIKGKLWANNSPLNDVELMKDFNAQLNITDSKGNAINTLPMDNINSEFSLTYTLPDIDNKFNFQIDAAGAGFFRKSNIVEVEIVNSPPSILEPLTKKTFMNFPVLHNKIDIDLYGYFKDDDDTTLNFEASSSDTSIQTQINNGILTISTNEILSPANALIYLTISDASGETINTDFNVFAFPLLLLILVILLIIAFIISIIRGIKKKKINSQILTGYFEYRFTVDGIWQEQKQEPLYNYRGIVPLNRIIKDASNYKMSELALISVRTITKEGQKVLVFENKSSYDATANFTTAKQLELKFSETISILNTIDNSELQITYLEDLFV